MPTRTNLLVKVIVFCPVHNFKIFWTVVLLVSVYMVNYFTGPKSSVNYVRFCYPAMNKIPRVYESAVTLLIHVCLLFIHPANQSTPVSRTYS